MYIVNDIYPIINCNFELFWFIVPFAVEEKTGTVSVVDKLSKYKRIVYEFEAIVLDDDEATLVTNVTIHVVALGDKGVFMRLAEFGIL